MNQAIHTQTHPTTALQPQWPFRDRLLKIRIKDYNLLAIRNRAIENSSGGDAATTRFYTIASQDRKIAVTESLSSAEKVFLNFESYKWSELYFQFFKSITHCNDHRSVFGEIIYDLENKLAHYYSFIFRTHASLSKVLCPIQRLKNQTQMLHEIQQHSQGHILFRFYLHDLILIALRQSRRAFCSAFISPIEAELLLGHFCTRGLIEISDDKLKYHSERFNTVARDLIANNGRMILNGLPTNQITKDRLNIWKEILESRLHILDTDVFESSFIHI